MLQTLHKYMTRNVPIYGMNQGTVGFLMNEYSEADLHERLAGANVAELHPLRMRAVTEGGAEHEARSEEGRVGKACVRPCRYRWGPVHAKHKKTEIEKYHKT